jgi:hypothetical protein
MARISSSSITPDSTAMAIVPQAEPGRGPLIS